MVFPVSLGGREPRGITASLIPLECARKESEARAVDLDWEASLAPWDFPVQEVLREAPVDMGTRVSEAWKAYRDP